ncbi:hypothetical protein [Bradyrhizobium elkanii]|nr:hypothetical protein [Bradyrhizobium elkanii]WLA80367.1 hypothetical protein QNJ99_34025 [Bradyrhizobium elkanii]
MIAAGLLLVVAIWLIAKCQTEYGLMVALFSLGIFLGKVLP